MKNKRTTMLKYPLLFLVLSIFWTPAAAQQPADSLVRPDTVPAAAPAAEISAGPAAAASAAAPAAESAERLTLDDCMR